MALSDRTVVALQVALIATVVTAFGVTVALTTPPPEYLPERVARADRRGWMYGYTFVDYEALMDSPHADAYVALVAQCLDFAYVHVQWSRVGLANDTLNLSYLGNLTRYVRALADRGVRVVVHVWVSSYSPAWMHAYTPELAGQPDRWAGIDPATANQTARQHRAALKWSMVHFQELLCQYFLDQGLRDAILGFCLDDETTSPHWVDFFAALTATIHAYHPAWETMAMFNREAAYHYTLAAGMDVNAMDVYRQDYEFVQSITYAYGIGLRRLSVLLDAMSPHASTVDNLKMRRLAWRAWFLGADSIGWYQFLGGRREWACVEFAAGAGRPPEVTAKTRVAIAAKEDVALLEAAWARLASVGRESATGRQLERQLLRAFDHARASEFPEARAILEEVQAQ